MPLTAEERTARAKLAATRRHHGPDADLPADAVEFEQAALDRRINATVAEGVAAFKQATPEQVENLRRLFAAARVDEAST
jgi:hypothetical protein